MRLSQVKVLDPACGSGNFLYVTLQLLKDLEKAVITYAADHDLGMVFPYVLPTQLYGIEVNPYAYELAQMTVWIGHLQWNRNNGFDTRETPILRPMRNFECKDAILERRETPFVVPPLGGSSLVVRPLGGSSSSAPTQPQRPPEGRTTNDETPSEVTAGKVEWAEPEWPRVDFIVGNPPFLGTKKLRGELGDEYVEALFAQYGARIPNFSDLCCYWFEKARAHLVAGNCHRAGLLATQGIRGGLNREVLKRVQDSGGIFFAESDRPWVLDGALVHVSFVGFDDGTEKTRLLDGVPVPSINPNLTASVDTTVARKLQENAAVGFIGDVKAGKFDLAPGEARPMLSSPNPHGRPNSDVLLPWVNARDVVQDPRGFWIADFGSRMTLEQAAQYQAPFALVQRMVYPLRSSVKRKRYREMWWLHAEPCIEMRRNVNALERFLVTPMVSKHRIFAWLLPPILADHTLIAFARADDYFLGVVHSRAHEAWALSHGTQLRERESGFRYTPTTCFETFPFPHPTPEQEAAIGEAARELNEKREAWLNPPDWTREEVLEFPGSVNGPWARYVHDPDARGIGTVRYPRLVPRDAERATLQKVHTLTKLYNERPMWLDLAHKKLDAAVFAAYDWDPAMGDEEILVKLLALNLARSTEQQKGHPQDRRGWGQSGRRGDA